MRTAGVEELAGRRRKAKVTTLYRPQDGLAGTDIANAAAFASDAVGHLVYCAALGGWLMWDGRRWARDGADAKAMQRAQGVVRRQFEQAMKANDMRAVALATQSAKRGRLDAMLALASTDPLLHRRIDQFDTHPHLLNCANGTIELPTGTLHPHNPDEHHTRLVPVAYDPSATAPLWEKFLGEVFPSDAELTGWVQRWCGYCATAETREHVFVIAYGCGSNGKGVLICTIEAALGDYATAIPVSTFALDKWSSPALQETAMLRGVRFAAAGEAERGQTLAAARIKAMTGEDTLTGKLLYRDLFTFRPTAKLWLSTNYRLRIDGTDPALARRLRQVPFTQKFEGTDQDKTLKAKLLAELPGVLRWIVDGSKAWYANGLGRAHAEQKASDDYLAEYDPIARFLAECCELHPSYRVGITELWAAFGNFLATNKEPDVPRKEFTTRLDRESFGEGKDSVTRRAYRAGLRLKSGGVE
jgi:putative DNA primase/helicase